ncbi:Ser/Thr protein phosphatase [Histomonas meleagridis]|uniref:Ser/Thr protein phosphatase n=1 Tax=Histomonas meleagridis TaxID=135588 RepID=UPI00355A5A61|nr:Ser/Thr protein phosphatase [Histomonas meleagridis]KAH0800959.1 Ser/Thr protein phosphatase [Histomonas meleagridis]
MNSTKIVNLINNIITKGTTNLLVSEIADLCQKASSIFLQEDSLLELQPPINVCGDIHGELNDIIALFQVGGFNLNTKYLFLGDYVDRGENGFEVFCLLIALKIQFPNNIFLLRGNHECEEISQYCDFASEVESKVSASALPHFYKVFDSLPIAAIISNRVFCVHGGISPELVSLEQIKSIKRPIKVPKSGLLTDLLWSDPSSDIEEWGQNPRGSSYLWGLNPAKRFLQSNQLCMILRGHQVAASGIDIPFSPDVTVVTVFTSSSAANQNIAAFLKVNVDSTLECIQLPKVQMANSFVTNEEEEENGIVKNKKCEYVSY